MRAPADAQGVRAALDALRRRVGLRRHLARLRPPAAAGVGADPPRRLNWSVGPTPVPGWRNADVEGGAPWDLHGDIRHGLALPDGAVDYAVSLHALAEIPYREVVPVLRELRRVLAPGGVLRLIVPDLLLLHEAYRRGDTAVFEVPDEEAVRPGAKLVAQLVWYGLNRTVFTHDALEELLAEAGFGRVERVAAGRTSTAWPEIVALDGRTGVSLLLEAYR